MKFEHRFAKIVRRFKSERSNSEHSKRLAKSTFFSLLDWRKILADAEMDELQTLRSI